MQTRTGRACSFVELEPLEHIGTIDPCSHVEVARWKIRPGMFPRIFGSATGLSVYDVAGSPGPGAANQKHSCLGYQNMRATYWDLQSDLFGVSKWPFTGLSWDLKFGHFEGPGKWFLIS